MSGLHLPMFVFLKDSLTNMKTIFYTFLILFGFTPLVLQAQDFGFRHYSIPEGLVQTQITAIHQDRNGFLWIGTKGGISRFDGQEFVNFTIRNGLIHNHVYSFLENSGGEIIIVLKKGLAVYSGNQLKNMPFPDSSITKAEFFYEDIHQKIWVLFTSKEGKYSVYQYNNGNFTNTPHPLQPVLDLIGTGAVIESTFRNKNKIWIKVNEGPIIEFDGVNASIFIENAQDVPGLSLRDENMYFRKNEGIFVFRNGKVEQILGYENKSENLFFSNLAIDRNAGIWFLNDEKQLCYFNNRELITTQLIFNGSAKLFFDREETLWIGGSDGDGLFCLENPAFLCYTPENSGMPKHVWSIVQDNNKNLWFGSFQEGLVKYDYRKFIPVGFPIRHALNNNIYPGSIHTSDHLSLISSNTIGVLKYDGNQFSVYIEYENILGAGMILFEDTIRKKLLVGCGDGNLTIRNQDGTIQKIEVKKPPNGFSLISISMDERYRYWLGYSRGISIFDGETFTILPNDECDFPYGATCQYRDHYGTLWVGNELGLFALSGKSYQQVGISDLNTTISSLAPMGLDGLLIGSLKGLGLINLEKFNTRQTEDIQFFDQSNGFEGIECAQNCISPDSRGNYWIATSDMVVRFDPRELTTNTVHPYSFFKSVETLNDSMQWIPQKPDFFNDSLISLSWKQNNLKINFGATCLRLPEKVRFSWFLDGNDQNWSKPGNQRYAIYTNLKPGKYTFLLKASNFDGVFCDEPVSLHLTIHHAWWQIVWVQISTLVFLVGFTVFWSVYYTNRRRNRLQLNLEKEKKLTELRLLSLQNQMDPHFVFNVLTALSSVILNNDKFQANTILTRFSVLVRNLVQSSDKITRSLEDEIDFVKNYLELQKLRFRNRFDFSFDIDHKIDPTLRIPKMIIQTYAENAVKHGLYHLESQGKLKIVITQADDFLKIRVEDNGIGRKKATEMNTRSTGKGMKIMKQYFEVFNERNQEKISFEIEDLVDENQSPCGTRVVLKIPLSMKFEI